MNCKKTKTKQKKTKKPKQPTKGHLNVVVFPKGDLSRVLWVEITHLAMSASMYLLGSAFWKSLSTAPLVRLSGRGGAHPASCSVCLSSAPAQGLSHLMLSDREGVASDALNEAYPAAGSLPVSQLAARGTGFESRSNCVASCPPFFLRDSPVSGQSSFSVTHRDCVEVC